MEEDVTDTQQGGIDASGVQLIFKGCDTGGTSLRSGDLGGHPPAWARPWGGVQTHLVRRMMGQLLPRTTDGTCKSTSAAVAREAAVFLTMEE